jgi:hypothetical protein
MIARLLANLRLAPDDLYCVLKYQERLDRAVAPVVESEAGRAVTMILCRPEPGRYVGLGLTVIKDRRKEIR